MVKIWHKILSNRLTFCMKFNYLWRCWLQKNKKIDCAIVKIWHKILSDTFGMKFHYLGKKMINSKIVH